jgi:DNA invertase Pin-like site-specific DNA recombinase
MTMEYVAYYRVSTKKQSTAGNGLDAQKHTVRMYLKEGDEIIAEFQDEQSGAKDNRSGLQKAIAVCKAKGATLLIAKLDRLSRRAAFIWAIYDSGLPFQVCNLPQLNAMTIGVFAAFAQHERAIISERTTEGMAAWKKKILDLEEDVKGYLDDGHEYLAQDIARAVSKQLKADRKEDIHHTEEQIQAIVRAAVEAVKSTNPPRKYVLRVESGDFKLKGGDVKLKYIPSETARVKALKAKLENAKADASNQRATAMIAELSKQDMSISEIARTLNAKGFRTRPRKGSENGCKFQAIQVILLAERAGIKLRSRRNKEAQTA